MEMKRGTRVKSISNVPRAIKLRDYEHGCTDIFEGEILTVKRIDGDEVCCHTADGKNARLKSYNVSMIGLFVAFLLVASPIKLLGETPLISAPPTECPPLPTECPQTRTGCPRRPKTRSRVRMRRPRRSGGRLTASTATSRKCPVRLRQDPASPELPRFFGVCATPPPLGFPSRSAPSCPPCRTIQPQICCRRCKAHLKRCTAREPPAHTLRRIRLDFRLQLLVRRRYCPTRDGRA